MRMRMLGLWGLWVVLGPSLISAPSAAAALLAGYGSVRTLDASGLNQVDYELNDVGSDSRSFVGPGASPDRLGSGSSSLHLGYVQIEASASSHAEHSGALEGVETESLATGGFADVLTFHTDAAIAAGARAIFSFDVSITASVSGGPASAFWAVDVATFQANGTLSTPGGGSNAGSLPAGRIDAVLPILFWDFPLDFSGNVLLVVHSLLNPGDPATSADAALSGELLFRGLTVVDAAGDPIPFSLTSESGFDWAAPVPEPSLAALSLSALALLAARRLSGS